MGIYYENDRQREFAAAVDELEELGLRPADVARMLGISKASVSNILSANQTPRIPTLELLKKLVAEKKSIAPDTLQEAPPDYHAPAPRALELLQQIRELQNELEQELKPKRKTSNSKIADAAAAIFSGAISYRHPRRAKKSVMPLPPAQDVPPKP